MSKVKKPETLLERWTELILEMHAEKAEADRLAAEKRARDKEANDAK